MAQPVWVLSVDLQTKTATFQSGMADAARAARTSFSEIKSGASSMGSAVSGGMRPARQAVMLLGEEFGVHLPRGITTFISSLGPLGAAFEAAFPFAAIAVGVTLLMQHLAQLKAQGRQLTEEQIRFGPAVQNAFNQMDQKILEAQQRSDELRNDHLGALRIQLQLIDKQSMGELVHSFEEVAKAADVVFAQLKTSWYTMDTGSKGASNALTVFKDKYDSLLAQGKDKEASDLLKGTLESAEKILAAQQSIIQTNKNPSRDNNADGVKYYSAMNELRAAGVKFSDKDVAAQQTLIQALQAQVALEGRIADLKKIDSANATKSTGNEMGAQAAAAAKEAADAKTRMGESAIAADRAIADASLTIQRASIQERLASDITFAGRERDIQLEGNAAQIAALDRSGKDYNNQLKGLQDKALEIKQDYNTKVAELTAKASIADNAKTLADLEASEREKISATMEGSAARLNAINEAIRKEQALNLLDTAFYRDLQNQKAEAIRQEAAEIGKLT